MALHTADDSYLFCVPAVLKSNASPTDFLADRQALQRLPNASSNSEPRSLTLRSTWTAEPTDQMSGYAPELTGITNPWLSLSGQPHLLAEETGISQACSFNGQFQQHNFRTFTTHRQSPLWPSAIPSAYEYQPLVYPSAAFPAEFSGILDWSEHLSQGVVDARSSMSDANVPDLSSDPSSPYETVSEPSPVLQAMPQTGTAIIAADLNLSYAQIAMSGMLPLARRQNAMLGRPLAIVRDQSHFAHVLEDTCKLEYAKQSPRAYDEATTEFVSPSSLSLGGRVTSVPDGLDLRARLIHNVSREEKDEFLFDARNEGFSYKDIKRRFGFREAESTLRGRVRILTRPKSERVRQPQWERRDVQLLCLAVKAVAGVHGPLAQVLGKPKARAERAAETAVELPWKKISKWMQDHDASYPFAPAACAKKWAGLSHLQ